jgi:DNA replication protein DnaC
MQLTYIRKTTFNINGTIIHSALAIPLNRGINELKPFLDEKNSLIKSHDQLCLLIIDEISLIRNQMLTFTDQRQCIVK